MLGIKSWISELINFLMLGIKFSYTLSPARETKENEAWKEFKRPNQDLPGEKWEAHLSRVFVLYVIRLTLTA